MLHQLKNTDPLFISPVRKTTQLIPLTSISDIDSNKYHEFFAPNSMNLNYETLSRDQKTDLILKIPRV